LTRLHGSLKSLIGPDFVATRWEHPSWPEAVVDCSRGL
jgi:hypothetical protein